MLKLSNREKILCEGLQLVHEAGFGAATVRDIVRAAGVPQGSFTSQFASKEAFGLEILDRYFDRVNHMMGVTLRDAEKPPLDRLRAYIRAYIGVMDEESLARGSLFGNFSAELSGQSEPVRERLTAMFDVMRLAIGECLTAAVATGEVRADLDIAAVASFVLSSLEGALLVTKADRDTLSLVAFERILFGSVLR